MDGYLDVYGTNPFQQTWVYVFPRLEIIELSYVKISMV